MRRARLGGPPAPDSHAGRALRRALAHLVVASAFTAVLIAGILAVRALLAAVNLPSSEGTACITSSDRNWD
jgi:hypothetical protein